MKISVMIIAKNEENYLQDCLNSVKFADEIVVIDDYSTDSTAEIARNFGAKVYKRKLDGFASQKNFGIKKCINEWVLILDADERLTSKLQKEIVSLRVKKEVAYDMPFRNYVGDFWLKHGGLYPDRHIRLINKKFAYYGPREIHETLIVDGKLGHLQNDIVHKTYSSYKEYFKKVKKYAALEAKEDKKRPSWIYPLKMFYIKFFLEQGYKDRYNGLRSAFLLGYYQYYKRKLMK